MGDNRSSTWEPVRRSKIQAELKTPLKEVVGGWEEHQVLKKVNKFLPLLATVVALVALVLAIVGFAHQRDASGESNALSSVGSYFPAGLGDEEEGLGVRLGVRLDDSPDESTDESPDEGGSEDSLYNDLGEIHGIAQLINSLVPVVAQNPILNENPDVAAGFQNANGPAFVYLITEFTAQHSGGPQKYSGNDMHEAHEEFNITAEEFDEFLRVVREFLIDGKFPNDVINDVVDLYDSFRGDVVTA